MKDTNPEHTMMRGAPVVAPADPHQSEMMLVDQTARFVALTPPELADAISTAQVYEVSGRLDDIEKTRTILSRWTDNLNTAEERIRQQISDLSQHNLASPTRG